MSVLIKIKKMLEDSVKEKGIHLSKCYLDLSFTKSHPMEIPTVQELTEEEMTSLREGVVKYVRDFKSKGKETFAFSKEYTAEIENRELRKGIVEIILRIRKGEILTAYTFNVLISTSEVRNDEFTLKFNSGIPVPRAKVITNT